MITIKGISVTDESQSEPWGGYDFSKDSLAVVAYGLRDEMCVLWTVGPHVLMELDEYCLSAMDILTEPENHGIWVWEGRGIWRPGGFEYPEDGEIELVGTYRAPTEEEWQAIRENRCPWDDEEWKLKEEPK
jgi:hypothetical protein